MGFRDDGDAARARADALERENQELRAALVRAKKGEEAPAVPASRLAMPWIVAGLAVAVGAFFAIRAELSFLLIGTIAMSGIILVFIGVALSFVIAVPENELVVLSGREHRGPDGGTIGYRIARTPRITRYPLLETAYRLTTEPFAVEVSVDNAYASGGNALKVSAECAVRVDRTEPHVHNAVQRFLGRSTREIVRVAQETVEGHLRGVVATHSAEELQSPRPFAQEVLAESEDDMEKLGLTIDSLEIVSVQEAG